MLFSCPKGEIDIFSSKGRFHPHLTKSIKPRVDLKSIDATLITLSHFSRLSRAQPVVGLETIRQRQPRLPHVRLGQSLNLQPFELGYQ